MILLAALASAAVVRLAEVDGAALTGRRYAVVVGPEAFADPAFVPLRYADDDARAVAEALRTRGRFDRVWTLTTPADTTAGAMRAAMAEVAREARSPGDTVVVYVSSHGTLARDGKGLGAYVVASDTRLSAVPATGVPQREWVDWMERLPSRRKVAVFATCHSGQGKSALAPDVAEELRATKGAPPLHTVSEATVVIGVCAMDETARESEQLGHDVYTAFFLRALDEVGDADGDGAVTVTEAHEHARAAAFAYTGGAQRAWARAEVLGEDPIVLSGERTARGAPVLASYRGVLDGLGVRVDGADKGALPGQVVVTPGVHRVELVDGDRVVERQQVVVVPGARLDLEDVVGRDRWRLGGGLGGAGYGVGPESGPILVGEVHLPRLLGEWELVGQGSTRATWPRPTLSGSLVAERALTPGAVELRVGGGLQGWLLQDDGAPPLLAPSLTPVPSISVAWTPAAPVWARIAANGGALWYADGGAAHVGWTAQVTLVAGFAP